ncbi:MAG: hypothetical protein P8X67_13090 [Syntrophobacterales bacterium]
MTQAAGLQVFKRGEGVARIFHERLAATTDMAFLLGVLGCRPLGRTVQVRKPIPRDAGRLPDGTPIFAVSRQQLKLPATNRRESSKCKVLRPLHCSSLAHPSPLLRTGDCAR